MKVNVQVVSRRGKEKKEKEEGDRGYNTTKKIIK